MLDINVIYYMIYDKLLEFIDIQYNYYNVELVLNINDLNSNKNLILILILITKTNMLNMYVYDAKRYNSIKKKK